MLNFVTMGQTIAVIWRFKVLKMAIQSAILLRCLGDRLFSSFGRSPTCYGQTDRRTHDHRIYRSRIASRGKKSYRVVMNLTTGHQMREPLFGGC